MIKFNTNNSLPNMADVITSWEYVINAFFIKKENIEYETQETKTAISFKGIIQPASYKELQLKPEGERAWGWFILHTKKDFKLDDIIEIEKKRYRIMSKKSYNIQGIYGYWEYQLLEDYQE